jgi:hypothetical protein
MNECACGKVRYGTKREAKRRIRRFLGRKGRLNAYRCPTGLAWHIGHLPRPVTTGEISRDEILPTRRRSS